jgi:hypothetical protein
MGGKKSVSSQGFSKVRGGVKKKSQSSRMNVIKNHLIQGATQNGLYNIAGRKQDRGIAPTEARAILVERLSAPGGRKKSTRETL